MFSVRPRLLRANITSGGEEGPRYV